MAERGFTLLEMLVVVAILLIALAVSAPDLRAYSDEAHLMGIGRTFEGEFRKAQSTAVRSLRNTAIVFDQPRRPPRAGGDPCGGRDRARAAADLPGWPVAGTLRTGGPAWDRLEQPAIVYVDPDDGATGVFADAAVIVRSSHPLDERSVRDVVHFVVATGLRDMAGHEVPSHVSRFVPCGLRTADLAE
jgi:prepilin-type N-terminal cleavage/methylation domain-containing protein